MSEHVFVVSEWLAKEGCDQVLWTQAQHVMALTAKEAGCVRAHATRQIQHPGSLGQSKYTIVLLQEYVNVAAFDLHCASDYIIRFFETYVSNSDTAIVEEWQCRLFGAVP